MRASVRVSSRACACVCARVRSCVSVYLLVCVRAYACACLRACVCVCVRACMRVFVCTRAQRLFSDILPDKFASFSESMYTVSVCVLCVCGWVGVRARLSFKFGLVSESSLSLSRSAPPPG